MSQLTKVLKHKYTLWLILAAPAWIYVEEFIWSTRYYPELMKQSGVFSIQLLVLSLCITPMTMILKIFEPAKPLALWLLRSRRYIGFAGFGYAAIHTALYVRYTYDLELIWLEAIEWAFGTGWISLLILIPLAITSNNWSVRKMGAGWKTLQRLSYVAIAAGLIHWMLLDFFIDEAMQWVIVLIVAKSIQIAFRLLSGRIKFDQKAATT